MLYYFTNKTKSRIAFLINGVEMNYRNLSGLLLNEAGGAKKTHEFNFEL